MAEPSRKKRLRDEEETGSCEGNYDEANGLERSLIFNDTLIALRMMRAQFPKIDKVAQQPFILQSQLYSSIKDRTQVDRDLESLKKEKILRLFKLNTGQDDHAIMFFEDYINQMDVAVKKLGGRNQHDMKVFEWFKAHVIESKLDFVLLSAGGEVKDEDITLLINASLLTRQMIDPNMYWFAIPNIGSILKGPEGTSLLPEPKKAQRDAAGPVGEETPPIVAAGHEVPPPRPHRLRPCRAPADTFRHARQSLQGLKKSAFESYEFSYSTELLSL